MFMLSLLCVFFFVCVAIFLSRFMVIYHFHSSAKLVHIPTSVWFVQQNTVHLQMTVYMCDHSISLFCDGEYTSRGEYVVKASSVQWC